MKKLRQLFKRNKESDTRVSRRVIIVLIIAISVMCYTFVQASVVPFWNKELETEHVDVVYSDMTTLKSHLTDVALHGIPRSSMIHLGVLYQNRFLFFNPGPGAAGNLTVEKVGITGSYTASGASTHPISYDSSRIVYVLDGIIPSPKLVYEHGIIIWDWGDNRTVTANNQSLINLDTGNVFIPVVNANPCVTSGVETEIFEIYPYSNTSDRTGVESVTITLDTDYPELWQQLLKEYIKAGLVSVSNKTKKIRISSSAFPYISLPDQPASGAVSSGIITFSKELPPGAVLTIPAAITQNATIEKNVTSTPTPTASGHLVSGSSGGGGGGGGRRRPLYTVSAVADKPPSVSTEKATNFSATMPPTVWTGNATNVSATMPPTVWTGNATNVSATMPPTVWTGNATNFSPTSATRNKGFELSAMNTYYSMAKTEKTTCFPAANVPLNMGFDFQDYRSVLVQFRYKAEGAAGWTETGWVQQNGSGIHTYTKQITNLSPNTTYYYMAMLLYGGMAVNGTVQSFTTCRESITPTVVTGNATSVSVAAATLNMAFEFHDYSPVQVQFRYKAEGASTWIETGWVSRNGSGAHKYAEPIANLSYVTTYYFRAQLLYDGIVIEGTKKSFTTLELPVVRTKTATNITDAAATLNMTFDFKDYRMVHVQFWYKAEGASVWNETKWVPQSGFGFRWYTVPIANLSSDTTYQFKARLLYDSTVLEGVERSFMTLEQPTVSTKTASNITDVSARLNMAFDLKEYNRVQVRFRYKAENVRICNETGWVAQNESHTYSEPIANLSSNTTYYFSALLLYDGTVIEGIEKSFRTFKPPTVRTENATNISDVSATLNMSFDFNDYRLVNLQFRYKAEGASAWNATGLVARNGSGAHTFAEPISNLTANTTYYFLALLFYDGIALNGTELNFTTNREPIPPTVWTGNATNVSPSSATGNMGFKLFAMNTYYSMAKTEKTTCVPAANVPLDMGFDFQDYRSVLVQFRYKAEGAAGWTETGWVQQNGSGIHTYTKQVTNLSPNTTYYYMAMLLYGGMAVNGTVKSITTCRESITPTVMTEKATNVSVAAATLNMAFEFHDYSPVNVQFRYKVEGASAWKETGWVSQSGSGSHTFAEQIANLSANTTYYFIALLFYDGTELNGTELAFTTSRDVIPPVFETGNATSVSATTATLNMAYAFHVYSSVNVQYLYKAEGASAWIETGWVTRNGSGADTYTKQITHLSPNTTYYYMAMLLSEGMAVNGSKQSFTTCREPITPTVMTGNATNISMATATLNMAFVFNDYSPVNVQFQYKAEGAREWNATGWVSQNGSGTHTFAEPIANLSANMTYYFSAQLLYDGTELNSTELAFTTSGELIPPVVVTENATSVSAATATLNMAYVFKGYSSVNVQYRYKAEESSTWHETEWVSQNGSGAHTFAEPIANLSANTTYYFSALLLYDGTELNGTVLSFTTSRELIPPVVMTENATNVYTATATLNMAYEFYDHSSVQVQYLYKAEGARGWNATGWVSQNGSGSHTYAEPIANLSYVRTYYFRAQLLYDGIVIEGAEKSFTTLERPAVRTKTATNITDAAATLNMAFDLKDYRTVQVQFRYKAEGASTWNETEWVYQSGFGFRWYTEPIAGLSSDTTYQFKARLLYDSSVLEGVERSFTTLEQPTVGTENASDITDVSARLNMAFDLKDYNSVQVRFRYKAENVRICNETGWVAQNGSHTYSEPIANLSTNTTYYFSALLLYDGTVIEGIEKSFRTFKPPTVRTENATNLSDVSATLNMTFYLMDYNSAQVQFRYKAGNASLWSETGWVYQNISHTYSGPIAGLSSNTTYYFIAQLLYDSTVIEGIEKSFRTFEPPTVKTEKATNISDVAATLNMTFDLMDYSSVYVRFRYKVGDASVWNETGWVYRNSSQAYSEPIANLSSVTTYYFKAQLRYDGTVIGGVEKSFMTLEPPTVRTKAATNISDADAILQMALDFNDYNSVQVQFKYKVEEASVWKDTNWESQKGSGFRCYTEPIAGLSSDTTYHFKALLRYGSTVLAGVERSFTTLESPTVSTENASDITDVSATLNMALDLKDYSQAQAQVQFRYKAENASVCNDTGWVSQKVAHTYSESITDLSSNTTYYFSALLLYDGTVIEGVEKSFRTFELPTVRTENATNISDVAATLNMTFYLMDYNSVQVQFRYKAEGASVWNDTGLVYQNISHTYSETIANLSTNTTYYFSALLLYDGTVIEGVEKSFTTLDPPTVTTENATNVSDGAATLNMTFELKDYSQVQVQFKYKAEGASVWNDTGWVYQNSTQTYSEPITNLSSIKTYYYKAQLLYGSTEIEGKEKSFMTLDTPTVHTKTATNITDAAATLNMAFDFNDYSSVLVQFSYKAKDESEWNDTGWVTQNGSGFYWYSEPIAGLSSSTVYQFKALLRYDGTVIDGLERSFISAERPTVSTKNAIVRTLPRGWTATLKMDYDFKDYDQGYVRFAYKKVGDADWDHTDWIPKSHSGSYDELIMGLGDHATYYFMAQLKYGDENNIEGDTLTFNTLGPL